MGTLRTRVALLGLGISVTVACSAPPDGWVGAGRMQTLPAIQMDAGGPPGEDAGVDSGVDTGSSAASSTSTSTSTSTHSTTSTSSSSSGDAGDGAV